MNLSAQFKKDEWVFLLDAAGVLYNEAGCIPGAVETVKAFSDLGPVFVVTNNSCHNPDVIGEKLELYGYPILPEHIISSGYGLSEDETICRLIKGKRVFWIGNPDAQYYLLATQFKSITTSIYEAEVIVIAASMGAQTESLIYQLAAVFKKHPIPVVCCNPDRFVKGMGDDFIPVAGFYAEMLEKKGIPIYWIGKPYENYAAIVKKRLVKAGLQDKKWIFFDDNPSNVKAMMAFWGATGCWIKSSGIGEWFEEDQAVDMVWESLGRANL